MRKLAFVVSIVCAAFMGCDKETPFDTSNVSTRQTISKQSSIPASITILEPGYDAEVFASGINTPEGMNFRGSGVLYVVDSDGSKLLKILPNAKVSTFVDFQAGRLIDVLNDPGRGMFVSDLDRGEIYFVTFSGNVSTFTSGLQFPAFMTLNSKGELFASELGNGPVGDRVSKFSSNATRTTVITYDNAVNENPEGLTFDNQGNLYVTELFTGNIRKFEIDETTSLPIDATTIPPFVVGLNGPIDLAFDKAGDLYVVGSNEVYRISSSAVVTVIATGLVGPFNGLDINSKNDIFISDSGAGEIFKITKTN